MAYPVASVKMTYDGTYERIDNIEPYTLDDPSSAGTGFTLTAGTHVVVVEAWDGPNATGELLDIDTITFTITPPPTPVVGKRPAVFSEGRPLTLGETGHRASVL